MLNFLGWLCKSKLFKVAGASTLGGTGLFALMFSMHGNLETKIQNHGKKVKVEREQYVKLVLKPIEIEIKNLNEKTNDTNQMVRDIRNHLLNK